MKILLLAQQEQLAVIKNKIGDAHEIVSSDDYTALVSRFELYDLIIDFLAEESPEYMDIYAENEETPVFFQSVKGSLAEYNFLYGPFEWPAFGFNGLPYFVEMPKWEMTTLHQEHLPFLEELMAELGWEYILSDDRVGMISARVICMIINEAYYTLQEGTANKIDIDVAMKLGTNYPYGPFEWSEMIGLQNVYELLEALYEDTKDERYKICPLLKREYLMS